VDHSLGDAALVSEFYTKASHLSVLRRCSHSERTRLKCGAKYRLPWQLYRGFFQSFPSHLIHLITVPYPFSFSIQQPSFYREIQTESLNKSRIKNCKNYYRLGTKIFWRVTQRHSVTPQKTHSEVLVIDQLNAQILVL